MKLHLFEQTAYIDHSGKNLAKLEVTDWDGCNGWTVSVAIGGETVVSEQRVEYTSKLQLMLPLVKEDTPCDIRLTAFSELPVNFTRMLKPVKKWKIRLLFSSHEDLGYCAYVNVLGKSCKDYLVKAMEIMDRDPEYRYMIEHYWWLKNFEIYATDEEKQKLQKYFASGNVSLNTPHSGTHTAWSGYEQLVRSTYYSRRAARREWGIDPKMALYADISGISWAAVSAFRRAGIRYAAIAENWGFRINRDNIKPLPTLFKWLAPNGVDSLLCWWQSGYSYPELVENWMHPRENFYFDETKARITQDRIDGLIKGMGDTVYDMLPICFYHDREMPRDHLRTVCREMNRRWAYPQMEMGLPDEFMGYILENFGDQLPVFSGEWPDQWADYATISPAWMGMKRRAMADFTPAEALATLTSRNGSAFYPKEELEETIWRLCEFDEHCWGTSSKHPQRMHRFNLNLVKRESAMIAKRNVDAILRGCIGTPSGGKTSVWNFLPRMRCASVHFEDFGLAGIPSQKMPGGGVLTAPISLPAFGCRSFELCEPSGAKPVEGNLFETPFYRVTADPETHRIASILCKASGEELLDASCDYTLGEFIYVHDKSASSAWMEISKPRLGCEIPRRRKFTVERGPVATVITKLGYEEQIGANVKTVITFSHYEPTIRVHVHFENAVSLMGDQYDRYKKNIFIAFPLRMPRHKFLTETAGGVIDESTDRFPVNPHDFSVVQNWAAVQDSHTGRGVALFTEEMPVVHYGGIHYNDLSSRTTYDTSHIYLYAASNRSNQLNFVSPGECRGDYHLSLLPYDGGWQSTIPSWSDEQLYTPVAGKATQEQSLLALSAPNLRLLALKKAEEDNAIILRVFETVGKRTDAELTLPFAVRTAEYTDNVEFPTGETAEVRGNKIRLSAEPFSYVTVRLTPQGEFRFETAPDPGPEVRNLFFFENENTVTTICFEKHRCEDAKGFEVYSDGALLTTLPNEVYRVQHCDLEITGCKNIEIKPLF